ncbi:MAG: hypothetical protein ACKV22_07555 [Bryobacteraceae bacterium]
MDQSLWMEGRTCRRAALLLCLTTAVASAQLCDTSDLAGGWLVTADGVVVKPEAAAGPFARAGLLTADENGNLSLAATTSHNGVILSKPASGRSQVNPDCTVDVRVESPRPSGQTVNERYAGLLGNNGREVTLLLTDPPGTTIRMTLTRLRSQSCGVEDVRGRFTLELHGWSNGVPVRRLGSLIADGEGAFRANTIVSDPAAGTAGEIRAETLVGTYSVTPECAFEFKTRVREVGGPATGSVQAPFLASFRGAGFDRFERAALIQDSPGTVVSGALTMVRSLLLTFPPPVQLLLSTSSMSFAASPSNPSRSAAFSYSLSDSSSRPVSAQASAQSGGGWLSVQLSGSSAPGSGSVSINASGLAAGTYAGSVTVSVSGAGSGVIGVVLTVTVP